TLIGVALTLAYVLALPRAYVTTAVIQVESPRVADPVSREVAGGPTSFRLQVIEQQIMSREAMLALMRRHDLFAALGGLTDTQRVVLMREAIDLDNILPGPTAGGGTDVSAILVTVTLPDPVKAAAVANEVAERIIALGSQRELARIDEARGFFLEEEARIAAAMVALEAEITRFKIDNVDALPEAIAARREEAARLDDALRTIAARRIELETQRDALRTQGNLRVVEQRQLELLTGQIGLLDDQSMALERRRGEIAASLARAPSIETALSAYARSLQQLQDRYAVTTRRLAEAETSRKLAENQQTEQLSLLEAAEVPIYASGSTRKKVAVMGAAGSVMVALGAALLLDLMNPVLRTAGQMERAVGIRPFVAIPYVPSAAERVRRKTLRVAAVGMFAFAVVAAVTVAGLYSFAA
ncbi:MAG: hypothetical protein ACK4OP_04955, partial [Gemmobacter sp.]